MVDDHHVFVTPDGCKGFIFPVSTVAFSLDRIFDFNSFPIGEIVKPENELVLTNDLYLTKEFKARTLRRLKGKGKNVFVNIKFLDCFQNPKFYQENNKASIIVVTEKNRVGGHGSQHFSENPVGIILPVRNDALEDHYNDNEKEGETDG